jgi:hypothetical protein
LVGYYRENREKEERGSSKKEEKKSGFYSPSYSASHIVVIKVQAKLKPYSLLGAVLVTGHWYPAASLNL